MKKLILLTLAILMNLAMFAQSTTVYFGNISKKTSIGLGIAGNDVTLSIMEVNKSKKFDSFELHLYDMNGTPIIVEMKEDTIYHLDLEKNYAHQKDFKLDIRNYNKMKTALDSQSYVIVDGMMFNGAAFAGVLRSLEVEQNLFLKGKLSDIRKVSIWNLKPGMEIMRFKHPRVKNFRYVRQFERR